MGIVDILASCVLMAVTIGFVVLAVRKLIRNGRGWRRMEEEDRKIQGMPFYGDMEEEIAALEAKQAKYAAVKQGMMQEQLTGRIRS